MGTPRRTLRVVPGPVAARRTREIVLGLSALWLIGCQKGDGAAAEAAEGAAEPAGGVVTLWTDSTELFMEHPALIVGDSGKFAVHLTDITDFAPLRSGPITLRFQPREGGEALVVRQDQPRAPGIYGPAPVFTRPGVYDLTLIVESPQARDSITVRGLHVYATADGAPRDEGGAESGISFLKEQQWKTPGFATAFAATGSVLSTIDATGTIEPAAGRFAEVTAPISGLVDARSIASSPSPGERVRRGQTLALLMPTLGEGGSAYADARARLRVAEDEAARAKRLVEAEAAPARRLQEAEIRLQAAREALAGFAGGALSPGGRLAITSPIAGIVASRTITPGSRVEAGAPLFTIVDPSVVWLRVNVPAAQGSLVRRSSGASFELEGTPRGYEARRVVSVGSIIDSLSRTLPVIYEVANSDGSVKVGATARVHVRTGQSASGVVIPAPAVLEEDGQPIAYVQLDGETFEKRVLTLGGRQGDRVLVLSGVRAGERVVTGAAYQIRLASLSTAVPAEGHEH